MTKTKKNEGQALLPDAAAVTAEDARRILLQEQTAKTEACMREVDEVLRKHGCSLDVSMVVTTRGVNPRVSIIPAPPRQ
jgi:hypothetical protein